MPAFFLAAAAIMCAASAPAQSRLDPAWPTPSKAFLEGRAPDAYIQPTASGTIESGLYGGTRNDGMRFHEGIDLKPVSRDRRGEPSDAIFAVLPGLVRHVNTHPGNSNYGRYIVLEHTGAAPAVYTLYAHLSAIAAGLKTGDTVARGQRIATMGRSSDVIAIPKARAHLHFEIGVRLTDNFQAWYDSKKFGGKNTHGLWNGMNLMGFDPLDFYKKLRAGAVVDFRGYMAAMKPAVRVRVAANAIPDFVRRYPSLVTSAPPQADGIGGWEITFNETGIPFLWKPLGVVETIGSPSGEVKILAHDVAALKTMKCRSLVITSGGKPAPGRDLLTVLELLFGK